jgi:hypothetical protein
VPERRALVDVGGVQPGTQGAHGHVCGSDPYRSPTPGAFVFGPQRRNEEDTGRRAHLVEVGRKGLCWIEAGVEAPVEVGEALRGWLIAAIGLALAGAAVSGGTPARRCQLQHSSASSSCRGGRRARCRVDRHHPVRVR